MKAQIEGEGTDTDTVADIDTDSYRQTACTQKQEVMRAFNQMGLSWLNSTSTTVAETPR
jgi:predicted nucleic acid-binding Zn ribbon protein